MSFFHQVDMFALRAPSNFNSNVRRNRVSLVCVRRERGLGRRVQEAVSELWRQRQWQPQRQRLALDLGPRFRRLLRRPMSMLGLSLHYSAVQYLRRLAENKRGWVMGWVGRAGMPAVCRLSGSSPLSSLALPVRKGLQFFRLNARVFFFFFFFESPVYG